MFINIVHLVKMWWFEETVTNFNGFNLSELNTDEALLNISSSYKQPLWVYILSENCQSCSFKKLLSSPILQNNSYEVGVNSQYGLTLRFRTSGEANYTPTANDSFKVCDLKSELGEFGVYNLLIENSPNVSAQCSIKTVLAPVNVYLPLFVSILFWILAGFILKWIFSHKSVITIKLWEIVAWFTSILTPTHHNANQETSPLVDGDAPAPESESEARPVSREGAPNPRKGSKRRKALPLPKKKEIPKQDSGDSVVPTSSRTASAPVTVTDESTSTLRKERLNSLDTFRGLCIIIMIFADDGGGGYYFLQHCAWDGLYVADLAFPWFLWICGVSIPFSIKGKTRQMTKTKVFQDILIRSLKLIFLGIMVNTSTKATPVQLEYLRLPGVLQRFGLCYFLASTLLLLFHDPTPAASTQHTNTQNDSSWKCYFKDFKGTLFPWIIVVACVGVHASIIFLLPVPDCPRGYLGPAGLHQDSAYPPSCVGGAAGYIDRMIFGINHIHKWPTSKKVYESGAFDPEGILGVLTSALQIWLGVQAGMIIQAYADAKSRLIRMLTWSSVCGLAGYLLCGGLLNSGWIPINKNLWSLSFVLVTCSAAFLLLAILYLLIDVFGKWDGSPLVDAGRNSILLYLAHEVCHAMIPWHFSYGKMKLHTNKLMETSWGIFLWILIAAYLHQKQLYFVV